jgi:hypothetical protein
MTVEQREASWTAAVFCRFWGIAPPVEKRQRAAALQNLAALLVRLSEFGHSFN